MAKANVTPLVAAPLMLNAAKQNGSLFVVPDGSGLYFAYYRDEFVGASKHKDYFEYHFKRRDVKKLNKLPIQRFIYGTMDGRIEMIVRVVARATAVTVMGPVPPVANDPIGRIAIDVSLVA